MGFSLKLRGASADEINKGVARARRILALTPCFDRYPGNCPADNPGRRDGRARSWRDPQVFLFRRAVVPTSMPSMARWRCAPKSMNCISG